MVNFKEQIYFLVVTKELEKIIRLQNMVTGFFFFCCCCLWVVFFSFKPIHFSTAIAKTATWLQQMVEHI